ncbi:acetolactate decarboxylase [Ectothiorhodosinus mongolicus]|uniref:Alpha-acetolactate decarboxylase n=1 Tax=Ectothiorhodosinus mongolicus TaxID=233100 RepID=A0A1R3W7V3_9GAMM|nr:acetolactate decarboxylase [Ectothiorhodosinus mongolicus]ULX57646.1 acetolactate decarboxylase [Ectothiorhodosinus mongolicus]SIT73274.1 acetolactate decarboxylase [Ectothiorhodosinus mongolicus]
MSRKGSSLYISAPVNALVEGLYREDTLVRDILEQGDFGIGTFNDLDGEMVVVDGRVYQLRADGLSHDVPDEARTPFACVTFFRPYSFEDLDQPLDYAQLIDILDRMVPSKNMLYAIRLEGHFDYVRTRSVPRQDAYKPLVEVTREQPEFEFENVRGTMVGFWTPDFLSSVAVPGYHLHFLTEDCQRGGHLLTCKPHGIRVSLQHMPNIQLGLPMTLDYLTQGFDRDIQADLNEAEH